MEGRVVFHFWRALIRVQGSKLGQESVRKRRQKRGRTLRIRIGLLQTLFQYLAQINDLALPGWDEVQSCFHLVSIHE